MPFHLQVACNRAAAAAKLGRHDEALADAELAIDLDAGYAKAYVRRAQVRGARAGQRLRLWLRLWLSCVDAAVLHLNSSYFLTASTSSRLALQAHQELGSLEAAIRDYEKAGEMQEDYPGGWVGDYMKAGGPSVW